MIDGKDIPSHGIYLAVVQLGSYPRNVRAIALRNNAMNFALTLLETDMGTEVILEMQLVLTSAKRTSERTALSTTLLWPRFYYARALRPR